MSLSQVKAGRAYVEIGADSSRLKRDLSAAGTQLREFGDKLSGIRTIAAGALAALSGAGVVGLAKSFADAGSAIDDLSQRSGASHRALSELSYAAKLSDTSLETLGTGLRKMQVFLIKAAEGSEKKNV